ncbi:MAG: response regulator [Lachnospiraceae bacterium]|nr:response regulator [Lachnospiraceae bacterium]
MLKVLLVDDEPFILQGLKVLIEWQKEGAEIVGTATNGKEALEFLKKEKVDLVITDIKMPIMTGIELLATIRNQNLSEAYFVILSGYADFSYAQEAIRYECTDYILKPVEREELIKMLHKVMKLHQSTEEKRQDNQKMERAYLARNMIAVIQGKFDTQNLEYVKKNIYTSEDVRYIEIALDGIEFSEEFADEEKRNYQRKLYQYCIDYLENDSNHCIFDVSVNEKIYDIGFVYCGYMAERKSLTEKEYLENFLEYLKRMIQMPVVMLVGKQVNDISNVTKSYSTACVLRSFQGFCQRKNIYYYEDEVQVKNVGVILCKKSLDILLAAIEQNSPEEIVTGVDMLYEEMEKMGVHGEAINLNINYMLFQLIHLATSQDDGVNQEEILRNISESTFEEGVMRGSKAHLSRFACEYAEYLAQLRKKVSHGVLGMVEKEIKEHYAENLTLKELSEKYYVNAAYLGQLFRKKYEQSFKDYLNNYRMEQASLLLVRTDKKIYEIAEEVGYHDLDYFVNRFVMVKGCSPAKFRKQARMGE